MKTINLKKTLAKYQSGWVAINKILKLLVTLKILEPWPTDTN